MLVVKGRHRNRRRVEERSARGGGPSRSLLKFCVFLVAIAGLVVLAAIGCRSLYGWASSSSYFLVKRISFRGLHHASEAELLGLANLSVGQNLFRLDASAAEKALLTHPWVLRASVDRDLPDALAIMVTEQTPVAVVSLGPLYLVSAEGRPFKKLQAGDAFDLPLITGIERELYVQAPEQATERLRKALEIAAAFGSAQPAEAPLSEIRLSPLAVTLVTAAGQEIRMSEGGFKEELARLNRVRLELKGRALSAAVIRLDNRIRPGWIAVKLSTDGASGDKENRMGR